MLHTGDPQPGIKPEPPALGIQRPNHWTTREVPPNLIKKMFLKTMTTKINNKMINEDVKAWTSKIIKCMGGE